jgi:hypothetical protein
MGFPSGYSSGGGYLGGGGYSGVGGGAGGSCTCPSCPPQAAQRTQQQSYYGGFSGAGGYPGGGTFAGQALQSTQRQITSGPTQRQITSGVPQAGSSDAQNEARIQAVMRMGGPQTTRAEAEKIADWL